GGDDTLIGGAGSDVLNGGLGADILSTGAGADKVLFNTTLGAGNVDQVLDFSVASDTFQLDNAVFAALAVGALPAAAFVIGAEAVDAGDRIIYDSATGALSYDADGLNGQAQVQFAQLATGLALTSADFVVV